MKMHLPSTAWLHSSTAWLHSESARPLRTLFYILLVLALLFIPMVLSAQARDLETRNVTLYGRVIDAATGIPVPSAAVFIDDARWGVVTDSVGAFAIPKVFPGRHTVAVEQLGYHKLERSVEVNGVDAVELQIAPDPILLEGIQVVGDRLERRRMAVATRVQAFDRETLRRTASSDVAWFIRTRTGVATTSCGAYSIRTDCAFVRGRLTPVTVYIDEAPAGGLFQLASYQTHELYMVEVYGGGQHIRAYTNWFMERAGKRRLQPVPFFW